MQSRTARRRQPRQLTRISRISLVVGSLVFFLTVLIFVVWIISEGTMTAPQATPTPVAYVAAA